MQRRHLLIVAAPLPALAGCSAGEVKTFATLAQARQAIEALTPASRSTGSWKLAQVLEHAAQSVEYSISGFPEAKSALFQGTVGRVAFAVFESRGQMGHSLSEPIPGAPVLAMDFEPARQRLLQSLQAFERHAGKLAPHFAYGALDKAQYTRAHLMHLANHWTEVVRS